MSLEGEKAFESSEIPESQFIETSRVLVLKKDGENTYKALFCTNSSKPAEQGKDTEKRSKYEIPGGKLFDDEKSKDHRFNKLKEEDKEQIRKSVAVNELEEETGLYLNQNRLTKISTEITPLTGDPHPDFPNATHRKTNVFAVILQDGEYDKLPENPAASLENDDGHSSVEWIPSFKVGNLTGEDLELLISRNSKLSPEAGEKVKKVIVETTTQIQQQVAQMAKSQNFIVEENSLIETEFSKDKKQASDKISSIDFNGQPPLSEEDFNESFEEQFGMSLDTDSIETFVRRILMQHCKPYLAERAKFLGEKPNGENQRSYDLRLEAYIESLTKKIQTPQDFYKFYSRGNNSRLGRRILRAFFGFGKISGLDYFAEIGPNEKEFQESLVNKIGNKRKDPTDPKKKKLMPKKDKKGRYEVSLFTHGRKCFLELDSGVKTVNRMASKSTTKAEVDPSDMKDVYRARMIVERESDVSELITSLKKKFGTPNSWKLKRKEETDSNINRDEKREEVKVIGRYPVKGTGGIPIEFMIMTKKSYEKNESGAKHHNVYEAIQTLVEESRPTDGIPAASYEYVLRNLINDENILKTYPRYNPDKPEKIKTQAEKELRAKFNTYFFEHEGKYYAYQHILRVRNVPHLIKKEDEIFLAMTKNLNEEIGSILTAQEWKSLFDNPNTFSSSLILRKVGFNLPNFLKAIKEKKWAIGVDAEMLDSNIKAYIQNLPPEEKTLGKNLGRVLTKGYSSLTEAEKKRLKKNTETLKDECSEWRGKEDFIKFLDSL